MKKIAAMVCCLVLLLCGCHSAKTKIRVKSEGFTCNASATLKGATSKFKLSVFSGNIIEAKFTDGSLKGMTVTLDGDELSVNYLGLSFTPPSSLYDQNSVHAIKEVFDDIKRADVEVSSDGGQFETDTSIGKATVTVRPDGFPTEIKVPDYDFVMTCSDFEYIN